MKNEENRMYENENTVFYAAALTKQARMTAFPSISNNPEQIISKDKNEIIKLIKQYPGSRFKSFTSFDEALKFVREESNEENVNEDEDQKVPVEEPSPFPSLDVKDLNIFKRLIINKQIDEVKELVWTNPRYLISNYFDSPTIIVQGARYNAIHLAIRYKTPEILTFVLETVNSVDFVQKMDPKLSKEILVEKRDHILDMYLNSPDKISFNTPLHMACKLGDLDSISILVSYIPILDTQKLNKKNQLPCQVVQDKNLKNKINELINSSVFITVTKSKENLDKIINKPCSMGRKILESKLKTGEEVQISAIVGPMTPEKSQKVYQAFKSPKKCTPEQRRIRLQDHNRGLERVAYELSAELNVPYYEYWSFLKGFANFCTENDLKRLDDYLRSVQYGLIMTQYFSQLKIYEDEESNKIKSDQLNYNNCDAFDLIDEKQDEDIFYSVPTSPIKLNNVEESSFYINGLKKEKIDYDVYNTIKLAFDKNLLQIEDENFKIKYPYVNRWFQNIKNEI